MTVRRGERRRPAIFRGRLPGSSFASALAAGVLLLTLATFVALA